MKCPTCKSTVASDAAVCPACDAVLDPSLLDAAPPPLGEADDPTGEYEQPPRASQSAPPAAAPRPRATGGARKVPGKRPVSGVRKAAAGGQRMPEAPPPLARRAGAARDWRREVGQEDWNEMPQGSRAPFEADKALDPEDLLGEARRFVSSLSGADKAAFFGLTCMFFACFFPWKETVAEGEVLGLMSSGVAVFALSATAIAALATRARAAPGANPLAAWVVQLACVGLSLVWCVIYARLSWDSTPAHAPIGNYEVWASKPGLGLAVAFFAGVVAALGTVLGLKESR